MGIAITVRIYKLGSMVQAYRIQGTQEAKGGGGQIQGLPRLQFRLHTMPKALGLLLRTTKEKESRTTSR